MDFVDDKEGHGLDVVAGLPTSTDTVPLLRRGDDEVRFGHGTHVRCDVACQLNHPVNMGVSLGVSSERVSFQDLARVRELK